MVLEERWEMIWLTRFIVMFSLCVSLIACAASTIGSRFDFNAVASLEQGMSMEEVIKLLGSVPYSKNSEQSRESWIYNYSTVDGTHMVLIQFEEGKVTEVLPSCDGVYYCQ